MKKRCSLLLAILLSLLCVLPLGLADDTIPCDTPGSTSLIELLFSSDSVSTGRFSYSSSDRALFALGVGMCLSEENVLDNHALVQAMIDGEVYVALDKTGILPVFLARCPDSQVVYLICNSFTPSDCSYQLLDLTLPLDIALPFMNEVFSGYWPVSLGEFTEAMNMLEKALETLE